MTAVLWTTPLLSPACSTTRRQALPESSPDLSDRHCTSAMRPETPPPLLNQKNRPRRSGKFCWRGRNASFNDTPPVAVASASVITRVLGCVRLLRGWSSSAASSSPASDRAAPTARDAAPALACIGRRNASMRTIWRAHAKRHAKVCTSALAPPSSAEDDALHAPRARAAQQAFTIIPHGDAGGIATPALSASGTFNRQRFAVSTIASDVMPKCA